jgi:3-dehydroquinate synthase
LFEELLTQAQRKGRKMSAQEERIRVTLPDGGGYPIRIGGGNLSGLGEALREQGVTGDVFLVSDRAVWGLHGGQVESALASSGYAVADTFLVHPGESSKSLENWRAALDRLVEREDGSSRRLFLLNFGGGVVGDLGGFVAASYRRGIPFVQVPTTLLAQVDSSVGGKTGVNHPGGKNLVGAFHQPVLVFMDLRLLETLPSAELRAGLAEVVKYGLIWDEAFFGFLERNMAGLLTLEEDSLRTIVRRSCEIKAEVVSRDERESKGLRTLLNFGHTFGHALEAATDYRVFLHGEAVGIGMLCAAWVSVSLGMLRQEDYERIQALLRAAGLSTRAAGVEAERVWEAMKRDKKFIHGRNRFVFLQGIGNACVQEGVDPDQLSRALEVHLT